MPKKDCVKVQEYRDRFGKVWRPGRKSVVRGRVGVFGITYNHKQQLLLTYPAFDLSWPQLPGGGVESGETLEQALLREYREEVGALDGLRLHYLLGQKVFYFADDKREFWEYTQHYFFAELVGTKVPRYGHWRSPEDAKAGWVRFAPMLHMHDIHKKVLRFVNRLT